MSISGSRLRTSEPDGHQARGQPVDLARRAHRRFGHEAPGCDRSQYDCDQRDPEEPVVVEVLDDHAREDDPQPAADAEDRREHADPARDLLGRELVADDSVGEREDAAARALDEARRDQHRQRGGDRGEQGPCGEDHQGQEQQSLLAVHVAEAAEDRGPDRGRQQVAGQQPGDAGLAGAEVVLHRRQRRHHRRAQQRVGHPTEGEHCERHVGMGPVRGRRSHTGLLERERVGRSPGRASTVANRLRRPEKPSGTTP
jgi:hypothetical protein